MCDLTRREWLIQSLSLTGAAFASQLPSQFSTPAPPPCDPSTKTTPARKPLAVQTGAPGAQLTGAPGAQLTVAPGAQLTLEGWVIGIRCGVIGGASVTAWAGDARTVVKTDATGRYTLTLVLPKVTAPSVNLRVDVPQAGKRKATSLTTVLNFPAAGVDPLLSLKVMNKSATAVKASFDVILDL